MAKKDLGGSMDDLFGKRGAAAPKKEDAPSMEGINKRTGKKKVLPETFQKTNYIMDPDVIKKFKAIAVLKGVSVNLLANEILGEYVKENFKL